MNLQLITSRYWQYCSTGFCILLLVLLLTACNDNSSGDKSNKATPSVQQKVVIARASAVATTMISTPTSVNQNPISTRSNNTELCSADKVTATYRDSDSIELRLDGDSCHNQIIIINQALMQCPPGTVFSYKPDGTETQRGYPKATFMGCFDKK